MPLSRFSWTSPSSSEGAEESEDTDESSLDSSSAMLCDWRIAGFTGSAGFARLRHRMAAPE